jgi:hypothetical protein
LRRWLPPLLLVAGLTYAVPAILSDIYNGYGSLASHRDVWEWYTYPPLGIWGWGDHPDWGFRHWLGRGIADAQAVDIYWFRIADATRGFSLLVPYYLALAAAALGWYALQIERSASTGVGALQRADAERPVAGSSDGHVPRSASSARGRPGIGVESGD